jgi:tetratricopeptide (TPR) repeat protein
MLMEGRANLQRVGDVGSQSTVEGALSIALANAGRDDEALAMSEESERHASSDDAASQMQLYTGRGLARGHLGRYDDALEDLAKAVDIARETDNLNGHAEALEAQAEVLRLAGPAAEAASSLQAAVELFRRKATWRRFEGLASPKRTTASRAPRRQRITVFGRLLSWFRAFRIGTRPARSTAVRVL